MYSGCSIKPLTNKNILTNSSAIEYKAFEFKTINNQNIIKNNLYYINTNKLNFKSQYGNELNIDVNDFYLYDKNKQIDKYLNFNRIKNKYQIITYKDYYEKILKKYFNTLKINDYEIFELVNKNNVYINDKIEKNDIIIINFKPNFLFRNKELTEKMKNLTEEERNYIYLNLKKKEEELLKLFNYENIYYINYINKVKILREEILENNKYYEDNNYLCNKKDNNSSNNLLDLNLTQKDNNSSNNLLDLNLTQKDNNSSNNLLDLSENKKCLNNNKLKYNKYDLLSQYIYNIHLLEINYINNKNLYLNKFLNKEKEIYFNIYKEINNNNFNININYNDFDFEKEYMFLKEYDINKEYDSIFSKLNEVSYNIEIYDKKTDEFFNKKIFILNEQTIFKLKNNKYIKIQQIYDNVDIVIDNELYIINKNNNYLLINDDYIIKLKK
jgi:hypothetical protein